MNVLQGVTLTDLKEARQTNSLSPQDRRAEDGGTLDERSCVRRGLTDDRRGRIGLTESTETSEISAKWSKLDEVSEINVYRSQFKRPRFRWMFVIHHLLLFSSRARTAGEH